MNTGPTTTDAMSSGELRKREPRGIRWCKRCSRKHPSNEGCLQIAVPTRSKAGNTVTRFIHISRLEDQS